MLSRLPWQKRSNRPKSSIAATPESSGYATQSQGADSSPVVPSQSSTEQAQHRSGLLSRSRSQRFSRQSLAEGFNRLTNNNNRNSYIASNSSQFFSGEERPPSVPTHPDVPLVVGREVPQARGLQHTDSGRDLHEPQRVASVYTAEGNYQAEALSLSSVWSPGQLLPPSSSDSVVEIGAPDSESASASAREEKAATYIGSGETSPMTTRTASTPGKSSSDSTNSGLDRWSQRRLQRLNTEQGFREQRQGSTAHQQAYTAADQAQPQPNPSGQTQTTIYQQRPQTNSSYGASSPPPTVSATNSPTYPYRDGPPVHNSAGAAAHSNNPSPPDANPTYQNHAIRQLQQSASFSRPSDTGSHTIAAASSPANDNNNPSIKAQARSTSRQSAPANGSGMNSNSAASNAQPSPMPGLTIQPPSSSGHGKDVGRSTPQLEDMTDDDINQLIADHKELREKYNKVKKYYFEKEDQVKTLQNSLAHQKLSQSRTSLDDSEYVSRFNRLDGLIAQLSFSIRKSWKTVPGWLTGSLNKDAIAIGKQEMTAAGRAIVSQWLVEEVFNTYFHPSLDMTLSAQLKQMQKNIRRFAAVASSQEDEEYLTSKIVSWRLTTMEGLQDLLRSPQCESNKEKLVELLKGQLVAYLSQHLDNPPLSDLEGGVHMIIELSVQMVTHLPQESRDVQIEYFLPHTPINYEQMKLESGIPTLAGSAAEEAAERASLRSANSDLTEDNKSIAGEPHRKRDMLSALTGGGKKRENKNASSSSVDRVHTSAGEKEDPRIRMAVGIAAFVRNRTVLVKAPVFCA